jgi:carbamoylphosphate synthase large subunit
MKRLLVTGAGGSAASNFIKSLRMVTEKFYIVGIDTNHYHLELSNAEKTYIVPPANSIEYLSSINRIIVREKIDLIHPQPEEEVSFLAKNKGKVKCRVFLPKRETIKICQNKISTYKTLKQSEVPVGFSYFLRNKRDLEKALNQLLKHNRKVWVRAIKGAGSKASLPVNNLEHAKNWISYWEEMRKLGYGNFMVSEFLPGKEFAFQSIWKNGNIITSQARERIEYVFGNLTPSGQSSSPAVAKTVHRSDVNKTASDAIKTIDSKATGIFCVDLKENNSGIPCVMEINAGRFFTTSNFFSEAGSNMPYYYIKMAFGEKLPNLPKYNAIPENWYWIRAIDMGYKLVKKEKWKEREDNTKNL